MIRDLRGGFTLLEVLLAISLISVLAGFAAPVLQSFQVRNDLDVAVNTLAQTFRRAQVLSQGIDGDTTWGVKVQSGSIVLFKGATYAGRDPAFDEVFNMPGTITPSGLGEVVFAKFSGEPQAMGTVTLTSSTSETRTITINEKGTITY